MTEAVVQTKIKNTLTKAGWRVVKVLQLSENGWPDLMAVKAGRTVFIECKATGQKPRPLQLYRIEEINAIGLTAFWTDNPIDDRVLELTK